MPPFQMSYWSLFEQVLDGSNDILERYRIEFDIFGSPLSIKLKELGQNSINSECRTNISLLLYEIKYFLLPLIKL